MTDSEWAANELELYTINTGELYAELMEACKHSLSCREAGRSYEAQHSMEGWLIGRAVPAYQREIDCDFRPDTVAIEQAAQSILDSFYAEYDLGNYPDLKP